MNFLHVLICQQYPCIIHMFIRTSFGFRIFKFLLIFIINRENLRFSIFIKKCFVTSSYKCCEIFSKISEYITKCSTEKIVLFIIFVRLLFTKLVPRAVVNSSHNYGFLIYFSIKAATAFKIPIPRSPKASNSPATVRHAVYLWNLPQNPKIISRIFHESLAVSLINSRIHRGTDRSFSKAVVAMKSIFDCRPSTKRLAFFQFINFQ